MSAFELNAVDYLWKPVDSGRLRETLKGAQERLEREDFRSTEVSNLRAATEAYETATRPLYLERIPVRRQNEIILLPVRQIASVVADDELLEITTSENDRY